MAFRLLRCMQACAVAPATLTCSPGRTRPCQRHCEANGGRGKVRWVQLECQRTAGSPTCWSHSLPINWRRGALVARGRWGGRARRGDLLLSRVDDSDLLGDVAQPGELDQVLHRSMSVCHAKLARQLVPGAKLAKSFEKKKIVLFSANVYLPQKSNPPPGIGIRHLYSHDTSRPTRTHTLYGF